MLSACTAAHFDGSSLETTPISQNLNSTEIKMQINGIHTEIATGLKNLYANSLEKVSCSEKHLILSIDGKVDSKKNSAWYLGMALFIPFWPAMPSHTTLSYTLNASLFCESNLKSQIKLQEEEEVSLFFYGAIRMAPINEASDMIHRKFAARLESALYDNKPTDASIFADYTINKEN
ncbi:MAG: hypothetical protein UIH18_05780 [Fibrobacteraceae bacterium]|nr:hypothetical protein [Fibrobacteraceae bacterium]